MTYDDTTKTGRLFAALVALMLAAPALHAADLDAGRVKALGDAIAKNHDAVAGDELAQWIMEGKQDYRLIDIREPAAFQAATIEGAINIPVVKLFDTQTIESLSRHRKIVLLSANGLRAAQAATLLRLAGLDAYALHGGFDAWALQTLSPQAAAEPATAPETREAARRAAIARALKNCDLPCPCPPAASKGYLPPLTPADEPPPPLPATGGGVLLDEGC